MSVHAPVLLRRIRPLLALAAALLPAVVAAQTGPVVEILEPGEGTSHTRMPLDVEVRLRSDADPQSLAVWLNGVDVSALFTIDPPAGSHALAWVEDLWDPAWVHEGANLLEAEVLLGGTPHDDSVAFQTEGDPYADAVEAYALGSGGGFNEAYLPDVVLGPPTGSGLYGGTLGVFSLGLQGEIVLAFTDNVIVDGPGWDFTVFENPFFSTGLFDVIENLFSEAGAVSVSQDGVQWLSFPCADSQTDHPYYPGCAGVYPVLADGDAADPHPSVPTLSPAIESFIGQQQSSVPVPEGSGGDSFDLADVGLGWARYVRIAAADHVEGPTGPDNAGFDLDAMAAVNSAPATDADGNGIPDAVEPVPEPGVPAALAAGGALLAVLGRRRARQRVRVEGDGRRRGRRPPALPSATSPIASSSPLPGSGTATRSSSAK